MSMMYVLDTQFISFVRQTEDSTADVTTHTAQQSDGNVRSRPCITLAITSHIKHASHPPPTTTTTINSS